MRAGVVGEFVPLLDPPVDRWLGGALKLEDDEVVAALIADQDAFDVKGLPVDCRALAGTTEAGDVLLVAISSRGSNRGILDVARYRSKYFFFDLNLSEVEHDTVTG